MPRNHNCNSDTAANHSMEWISFFYFAQTPENHYKTISPSASPSDHFVVRSGPRQHLLMTTLSCLNTSFSSQLSFGFTSTALPRHFQKPIARPSVCTVGATRGATLKLFVSIENSNIFFCGANPNEANTSFDGCLLSRFVYGTIACLRRRRDQITELEIWWIQCEQANRRTFA